MDLAPLKTARKNRRMHPYNLRLENLWLEKGCNITHLHGSRKNSNHREHLFKSENLLGLKFQLQQETGHQICLTIIKWGINDKEGWIHPFLLYN